MFLSDSKFKERFGNDVIEAMGVLDGSAEEICRTCGGKCCDEVRCLFYSRKFLRCPIYSYRPARCRLYYCSRIIDVNKNREVASKLSQIVRDKYGFGLLLNFPVEIRGFDWPELSEIKEEVRGIIRAVERGNMSSQAGEELLCKLVSSRST